MEEQGRLRWGLDIRRLLRWGVIGVLMAIVPRGGDLFLAGLTLYALTSHRHALKALLWLSVMIMCNKALISVDISVWRWIVLAAATLRLTIDAAGRSNAVPRPVALLIFYSAVVALTSATSSWYPALSLFKIVSFLMGSFSALTGFWMVRDEIARWEDYLMHIFVFLTLGSIPFFLLPSIGYARNGEGFQGVFTHPQTAGPIMAIIAAYLAGRVILQGNRNMVWWSILAAAGLILLGSRSRTGVLAFALGAITAAMIAPLFGPRWMNELRRALDARIYLLVLVFGGLFGYMYRDAVVDGLVGFLLKDKVGMGSRLSEVTGALLSSRESLMKASWKNFQQSPLLGIGFGIPSDPRLLRVSKMIVGFLPTGASVEKGFLPTAVLEETGILGASLLIVVLGSLLLPSLRSTSLSIGWVLLTTVLVNMGEAVLFAIGGNGLFLWLILGFCFSYAYGYRTSTVQRRSVLLANASHQS